MVLSKEDPNYRQCSVSVMDNIADPDITFDDKGICNYFYEYNKIEKEQLFSGKVGEKMLDEIIAKIKNSGKGGKYDCVIGVSGGVDSSYVAMIAKKLGLRGLLVHFDNGWNNELAVKNIQSIVQFTGFDLYTYVVDWPLFRDVQRSLLYASVVDIELCTDMFIGNAVLKQMKKYNIKYSLSGNNVVSEAILPQKWYHDKGDFINIKNIHDQFGVLKRQSLPIDEVKKSYLGLNTKYKTIKLLNYMNYNVENAKLEIISKMGWRDYGGKHWESLFTKFYQAHILPEKFNIDKRKAHLSNLIFSKQISKMTAIEELNRSIYSELDFIANRGFVLKKLELSISEFNKIMLKERVEHSFYGTIGKRSDYYPILKYFRFIKQLYNYLNGRFKID
jgi:N-acetyl sugar amidotransferase